MRLLPDTCVFGGDSAELQDAGCDVVWAGAWPEDPGGDPILALTLHQGRALESLVPDFGELAIVRDRELCGNWR